MSKTAAIVFVGCIAWDLVSSQLPGHTSHNLGVVIVVVLWHGI